MSAIQKNFRFTKEDQEKIDEIRSKLRLGTDIDVIRYLLTTFTIQGGFSVSVRVPQASSLTPTVEEDEELIDEFVIDEFAKWKGYMWRDQAWDSSLAQWKVTLQNPVKPFNKEEIFFSADDPSMNELHAFLSPRK